jgi:hypothetical protein
MERERESRAEHTGRQLTRMLLLLRLLLGEEEVRLGGTIAFPKGGHGYLSLSRRSLAGSKRRETLVVGLSSIQDQLSRSALSHSINRSACRRIRGSRTARQDGKT